MISGTTAYAVPPTICRSSKTSPMVASWMRWTMDSSWAVAAAYSDMSAAVIVAIMRTMLLRERMYSPLIFTLRPVGICLTGISHDACPDDRREL